jgi:hypothetical protein
MGKVQTYEEQIAEAADWVGSCQKAVRQAPRGLKPYRMRELDEARRYLTQLLKYPSTATQQTQKAAEGPKCACGALLLKTKYGPICAAGTHDD